MKIFHILPALLFLSVVATGQDKIRTRVSVQYIKIMKQESFISISAKYKNKNDIEPAPNLEFHIYQKVIEDSLLYLGIATTNTNGKAEFILSKNLDSILSKNSMYAFVIKLENNPRFSDVETELTISDVNLIPSLETVDSINYLTATLTNATGQPLPGQLLKVQLQRMFAPLLIGKKSYETDENGSIQVVLEEPMPGQDGVLTFEIVLSESEEYGTIKALISAPIGIPVIDQSTFDKRTMWSPPAKAPYYLLIFPNLIILGVWIPILILLFNLSRISKS